MWRHPTTTERLDQLEQRLDRLLDQRHEPTHIDHLFKHLERTIMAAIDDLKASITELSTEVARIAGEIDQLLAVISTPGTSDADIAAAVDQIRTLSASLKAASDKSDAAVP